MTEPKGHSEKIYSIPVRSPQRRGNVTGPDSNCLTNLPDPHPVRISSRKSQSELDSSWDLRTRHDISGVVYHKSVHLRPWSRPSLGLRL